MLAPPVKRNCVVQDCSRPYFKGNYCDNHYKEFNPTAAPPASRGASAGIKFGGSDPKCNKCGKTVYPSEIIRSGGTAPDGNPAVFHRAGCFRCATCDTSLDLNTAAPDRDKVYCRTHYNAIHVSQQRGADGEIPKLAVTKGARATELKIGGVNPSCAKCGKSVYAEEAMKSGADDENGKQVVFHATCFKCETCNITLDHVSCVPDRSKIYCKRHYEEMYVQGRRTDDEIADGKRAPQLAVRAGATKTAVTIGVQQTKCKKCGKSVYSEEMMRSGTSDDAGAPCCYHKACFRCETCGITLDTRSVAPDREILYCLQHYREIHVALKKSDDEIAEGKLGRSGDFKAKAGTGRAADLGIKSDAPDCTKCGKVVYTEEIMRSGTSDEAGKPCVYHRTCFKCATCNTQLDTTSCAPDRTVLYCISHYREIHINLRRSDQEIADNKFNVTFSAKPGVGGPSAITMTTNVPNCSKCQTPVHTQEGIRSGAQTADGQPCFYHKSCFKCSVCSHQLELTSVQTDGLLIYCPGHYREIHVNRHHETGALAQSKPSVTPS